MSGELPPRIHVSARSLEILRRLETAGYETWCVGGAIRDALHGEPQQDVDLATAALPEQVQQLFRRTVAIGVAHGTVGVLDDENVLHEVTTFRRDVQTDGRHAVVEFGGSLDDDLARRDFTVNAIAFHPLRLEWRDPFHGYVDLCNGVIRAVHDPAARFREDRLRILRALRFAARFGFRIEPQTWTALKEQARDTGHLSAERVRDEWIKGIRTAAALDVLVGLWLDSGVAATWLPECSRRGAGGALSIDVADREPVRVTALYCSPGASVWRRLKGSNVEIRRAEAIDLGPGRPGSATPRDVRRWMARVGDAATDLKILARWRNAAVDDWPAEADAISARGEATSRGELAVSGSDLIAAGVPAGPAVGQTLERLLNAVLDNPMLNTRESLLALAGARA